MGSVRVGSPLSGRPGRKWKRSKGGCWMWFRGKWSLRTSSRRALPSSDNYQSRTHNRVRMAICLASVPLWLLNIWHRLLAIHMFWVAVWVCEWLALAVKEIFVTFDFIRFVISLKAVHHRCPLEKDNHIIWHHGLEGRCLESNNNIYIAILKIELGIEQQYIVIYIGNRIKQQLRIEQSQGSCW